jgi:SAM-dependent methyltransferase
MTSSKYDPTNPNHFDDWSDLYASARPRYPGALYAYLAGLCHDHARAWDAACGGGQAAVDLAAYFAEVQATDASQKQITNALSHPRVTYSVQPSEVTDFAGRSFDLVCVAQALHWFDHDRFWTEVKRVLKPGGIIAAWGYTSSSIRDDAKGAMIDAAIERSLIDIIRPYWLEQNKFLWNHYQDVPFPFERLDVPVFEMSADWDLDELFAYLSTWSSTRRAMAALGDGFFTAAYEAVLAVWGNQHEKRKVVMDFCAIAGRVGG